MKNKLSISRWKSTIWDDIIWLPRQNACIDEIPSLWSSEWDWLVIIHDCTADGVRHVSLTLFVKAPHRCHVALPGALGSGSSLIHLFIYSAVPSSSIHPYIHLDLSTHAAPYSINNQKNHAENWDSRHWTRKFNIAIQQSRKSLNSFKWDLNRPELNS